MFIDFEGIDGSGKTTLSHRLAVRLRELGYRVHHAARGSGPGSPLSDRIRSITRDTHELALGERTELLLNAAGEAQMAEDVIRPALAREEWVVADGFAYGTLALATHARGLTHPALDTIIHFATGGLQPDLVVLVDVAPALARARKRCQRIVEGEVWDPTRKPQGGAGLSAQEREGFLALAARDPQRWVVLDNTWTSLDEAEDLLLRLILERAARPAPAGAGAAAALSATAGESGGGAPPRIGGGPGWRTADYRPPIGADQIRAVVLEASRTIAGREAPLAAHLLRELSGTDVDEARLRLARLAPAIVAHGLRGIRDHGAMVLRHLLKAIEPRSVARSLLGMGDEASHQLRRELLTRAPADVARSLAGLDDPTARELRRQLTESAPAEVLLSLRGLDSPEAWALRERLSELATAAAHAFSVDGVGSEEAWALRERLVASAPVAVVQSLRGIAGDRAHAIRGRLVRRAPRAVLESVVGLDDDGAWQLRDALSERMREAVESTRGLESERAWSLRERVSERWPAAVARSLAGLLDRPEALEFLLKIVARHPEDLEVLRNAAWALDPARGSVGAGRGPEKVARAS